jgi:hypothetical protein
MPNVETAEQTAVRRRLRQLAVARTKAARLEADAIVEALRAGVRQVDVVRDLDRSREHVRKIAREAEADGRLPRS